MSTMVCEELIVPDADKAKQVADGVMAEVKQLGGTGGVIFVTPQGAGGWSFNTPGMYRAKVSAGSERTVAFYGED